MVTSRAPSWLLQNQAALVPLLGAVDGVSLWGLGDPRKVAAGKVVFNVWTHVLWRVR